MAAVTQKQITESNQIANVMARLREKGLIALTHPPGPSGTDALTAEGKRFVESCGGKVRTDALLTVQRMTAAQRSAAIDATYAS